MFKCTLGHKRGNLDSSAQTGLVITHKKGPISLLFFFFLFKYRYTLFRYTHEDKTKTKSALINRKLRIQKGACHRPHAARGRGERGKLQPARPNLPRCRAAGSLRVTVPKDATSCRTSATSVAGECRLLLHPLCSLGDISWLPLHHYTKKMPCSISVEEVLHFPPRP